MRRFKLFILSLLGFSTACSGVKNGSGSVSGAVRDTAAVEAPRIHVMYGVRSPQPSVEKTLGAGQSGGGIPAADASAENAEK